MKPIVVIVTALIAGFLGGLLGTRFPRPSDPGVIRAHSFELVNETGQTISFWGVDTGRNAVLAFGDRGFALGGQHPNDVPIGLQNPHNQLAAFGLRRSDDPFMTMNGVDGKVRARLGVNPDGKPTLRM